MLARLKEKLHRPGTFSKQTLKNSPGFDKDKWPNFADANWNATVERFYGGSRQAIRADEIANGDRQFPGAWES